MNDLSPGDWRGTSDSESVVARRACLSPAERLQWLEDALAFAVDSGSLAGERRRRQAIADAWVLLTAP